MRKLKKRVRDAQTMDSMAKYSVMRICNGENFCNTECDAAGSHGTTYYTRAYLRDSYADDN